MCKYKVARGLLIVSALLWIYIIVALCLVLWPYSLPLPICLVFFLGAKKGYQKLSGAYGTARWADRNDMKYMIGAKSGPVIGVDVLERKGLKAWGTLFDSALPSDEACRRVFCQKREAVVRLPNAVNLAVFAPVGAGKSSGMVIPFLIVSACEGSSCIILDMKGELALATAMHRRNMGHEIQILDPYRMVTQ